MNAHPTTILLAALLVCCSQEETPTAAGATRPPAQAPVDPPTPPPDPAPGEPAEPAQSPEDDAGFARPPAYFNQNGAVPYLDGVAILARDPTTGDLGFGALSSAPACGARIVAAQAGVGVVAAMGKPDATLPGRYLELLAAKIAPEPVLGQLPPPATSVVAVLTGEGPGAFRIGEDVTPRTEQVTGPDHIVLVSRTLSLGIAGAVSEAYTAAEGLPLPERIWVALHRASRPRVVRSPPCSAVLLVVRRNAGADRGSDRLVDLRIDYASDPYKMLKVLLRTANVAYIGPRLRNLQKSINDVSDPAYQANKAWLRRIRQGVEIGVAK